MSLLNSESIPSELRDMKLFLTPVDSGSPTKDFFLVTDQAGEQVAEVVLDTISDGGLVTLTLFNGQVEHGMTGEQEIEDWLEARLARLLDQNIDLELRTNWPRNP